MVSLIPVRNLTLILVLCLDCYIRTVYTKQIKIQASRYECAFKKWFFYFSSKTYVVGTQKNRLDETVLLSTQNKC